MEKAPFFGRFWSYPFPVQQDDPIEDLIERRWWARLVLAGIDVLILTGICAVIEKLFIQ